MIPSVFSLHEFVLVCGGPCRGLMEPIYKLVLNMCVAALSQFLCGDGGLRTFANVYAKQ